MTVIWSRHRTWRLLGLVRGGLHELSGQYVISYDAERHCDDGSYDGGELICTPDRDKATRFTLEEIMRLYDSGPSCDCHYWDIGGQRNRPLRSFNCEMEAVIEN